MDASIPGRYGFRRRSEQRQAALDLIWSRTRRLVDAEVAAVPRETLGSQSFIQESSLDWGSIPSGLDPAEGELDDRRSARKRAQVASLAAHAVEIMTPGAHVVEFGAGSGHLGLLIAFLRPDVQVVLVEMKEYCASLAQARIERVGLSNCRFFHGTVDGFAATKEPFDLAIGLHTCGLLADAVLALTMKRGASACIVPCCYGQIATQKEDHQRGEGTAVRMHPCSAVLVDVLGSDGKEAFSWCARSADFTPGKGGEFDAESSGFRIALRCMRTVDTDRLWWAREHGYEGSLGLLEPLGCSPKCSVIRILPGSNRKKTDEDLRDDDAGATKTNDAATKKADYVDHGVSVLGTTIAEHHNVDAAVVAADAAGTTSTVDLVTAPELKSASTDDLAARKAVGLDIAREA